MDAGTRINLLPWRTWERARRAKAALSIVLGAALAGAVLVAAATFWLEGRIDAQESRNRLLGAEIAVLDGVIDEARKRREQYDRAAAHIALIHELRVVGVGTVRVLDALASTLIDGAHYRRIARRGATLEVAGVAESNSRIAALMRNLEDSVWFDSANLKHLREEPEGAVYGPGTSAFEMTFLQRQPVQSGSYAG